MQERFHVKHHIDEYVRLLKAFNEHTNVYSASAYERLPFHIEDGVVLAGLIGNTPLTVVDIGSGSGLPSVIIAICNPLNRVKAVESKMRKCRFLELVKKELGLDNYEVINKDIHELARSGEVSPDVVTAKAFGPVEKVERIVGLFGKRKIKVFVPISRAQADMISSRHLLEKDGYFYYFSQ